MPSFRKGNSIFEISIHKDEVFLFKKYQNAEMQKDGLSELVDSIIIPLDIWKKMRA